MDVLSDMKEVYVWKPLREFRNEAGGSPNQDRVSSVDMKGAVASIVLVDGESTYVFVFLIVFCVADHLVDRLIAHQSRLPIRRSD